MRIVGHELAQVFLIEDGRPQQPLLLLKDICLTFGSAPLLDGAELAVGPGERLCLVGRNGSGKSTLLKIADGRIEPDKGYWRNTRKDPGRGPGFAGE